MSAPTPALIVLYDSDAVEVRYSDGSRLELSPCGATMIYQPPIRKGEHPRQGLSSRVHKRTCFVTSEHKKLVLQTLDFRNRFAQRPYLCEELLNKEEILSLYASVDSIRWPESADDVNILADGSRKITSLDDFANLIISPHGQDFSISYLSRISFDDKGKHSNSQFLQSSNVSYCLSRNRGEHSSLQLQEQVGARNNEAIVQPFQLLSLHDRQSSGCSTNEILSKDGKNETVVDLGSGMMNKNKSQIEDDNGTKNLINQSANSDLDQTLVEQLASPGICNDHHESFIADGGNQVREYDDNAHNAGAKGPLLPRPINHDESGSGIPDSSVAHDISSISRSSTPDGLRTTIDSDATLIHENDSDALPGQSQRKMFKYHRHSSPTHSSSPLNEGIKPFMNCYQMKQQYNNNNKPSSLDGSYLETQRQSPEGFENNYACGSAGKNESDEKTTLNNSLTNFNSNNNNNNNCVSSLITSEPNTQNDDTVKFKNVQTMQNSNTQTSMPRGLSLSSPKSYPEHANKPLPGNRNAEQALGGLCVQQKEVPSQESNRGYHFDIENTCKHSDNLPILESRNIITSGVDNNDDSSRLQASYSQSKSSENSPRPLLSVSQSQPGEETTCRKKYVWVTAHASRNSCPKEWTHPLMLALKAESGSKKKPTTRKKERHKQSVVPKPLPLTCPFQHKHRMSGSHSHSSDSGVHSQASDDSFVSTMGEFQQGRLKVVVSEGIIYRLIACNDMTVVEVYPGDGTVLVSQGVKAIFFTHFIPRTNMLEERTYSLKSLPPGCAKGRHSIEKMMKTAYRLVQICLNWDKRCGQGKSPCWQKEIVAVVEPLSSSLLEECCVEGLGRFSAFTNGRVRVLFDDRTALDTVADFQPRLGNATTDIPHNALYKNDSGITTARLLVPSGNYVTVEMNKPGPYAKYSSAAKEWIAWVNASIPDRQEFYKQQNQPHILQQAAELELKKIFCFNYIVEHTAALSSKSHQDVQASTFINTTTPSATKGQTVDINYNNKPLLPQASAKHFNPSTSPSQFKTPSVLQLQHYNSFHPQKTSNPYSHSHSHSSPLTHNVHINNVSGMPHHISNISSIHPSSSSHISTTTVTPQPSQHYTPHHHHHLTTSTPLHNPLPPAPPYTRHFSDTRHTSVTAHEDRCVNTTMGFQSVRSALARTSSLINDIDMFLEERKS